MSTIYPMGYLYGKSIYFPTHEEFCNGSFRLAEEYREFWTIEQYMRMYSVQAGCEAKLKKFIDAFEERMNR